MYKNEYSSKIKSCEIFLDHIITMEEKNNSVKVLPVLKTSFILSLYNLVESTVTDTLTALHDHLLSYKFLDLSEPLKELFGKYFKNTSDSLEKIIESNFSIPSYKSFDKYLKLYSGNLDMRKIRDIFRKYGMQLKFSKQGKELLFVKNFRNKIMHGEIDFLSGRSKTSNELKKIFSELKCNFIEFFNCFDSYMKEKKYLLRSSI